MKKLLFLTVTAILCLGPAHGVGLAEVQPSTIDQERTDKQTGLE